MAENLQFGLTMTGRYGAAPFVVPQKHPTMPRRTWDPPKNQNWRLVPTIQYPSLGDEDQ